MSLTETTAWVKTLRIGGTREVYHTDESCRRLEAARETRPASDHELRDCRECKACAGTQDYGNEGGNDPLKCPICGDEVKNLPNHMRACQ